LKLHPEWAQAYAQPTQDAELAQQYATMARYPARWMVLSGIDDPAEQVRTADRYDRRFQKAHADRAAQAEQPITPTAPAPVAAPPAPQPAPMPPSSPPPAPVQPQMGA
jgi:hypothetical protein